MPYIRSKAQTHSPPHVAGSFVRGIWIFDPRSRDESLKEHQRQTCAVTPSRLWSQGYIPRHIYGPPKQDKSITTYSSSYKSDINLILSSLSAQISINSMEHQDPVIYHSH